MDSKEYLKGAISTEMSKEKYDSIYKNMSTDDLALMLVLFNRASHIASQIDFLKKKIFYGDTRSFVHDEIDQARAEHGYLLEHIRVNNFMLRLMNNHKNQRIFHGIVGTVGEAGELAQAFSKFMRNGRLDEVNLKEEIGDCSWYQAVTIDALNSSFEEIFKLNNAKLFDKKKGRFKDGFSENAAINRNTDNERQLLEATKK